MVIYKILLQNIFLVICQSNAWHCVQWSISIYGLTEEKMPPCYWGGFLKAPFQLGMCLKKGQKPGRDERTREHYPTFAKSTRQM